MNETSAALPSLAWIIGLLAAFAVAAGGGWLADDALVVIELPAEEKPAFPEGFREVDDRRYGATRIICAQYET